MPVDILLINMPWAEYYRPSLSLGLIQAIVRRSGLNCRTHYASIAFAESLGPQLYELAEDIHRPYCEWVFTASAFNLMRTQDKAFFNYLEQQNVPKSQRTALERMRFQVDRFLDECLIRVQEAAPKIVGFTTSFLQTNASAALATRIRSALPETYIVFGGAACRPGMIMPLMSTFTAIDVAVGEYCDMWVADLFNVLLEGRRPERIPGVVWRSRNGLVENPPGVPFTDLDANPNPDFTDFFKQMEHSSLGFRHQPSIPFEGSRGCWWGQRRQCLFCGVNGPELTYRTRSAENIVDELSRQRQLYGVDAFIAADEIIPHEFWRDLPPLLEKHLPGASIFYEMRPLIARKKLRLMTSACQLNSQPGIEQFSTRLLGLLNKNLRGIDNVTMLRRAHEFDMGLMWNMLFGIPGEQSADYEAFLPHLWRLRHFKPPFLFRINVTRFSPYYNDPEKHGIRLLGPELGLSFAFPVSRERLAELAFNFEYAYTDGYDPIPVQRALEKEVSLWWDSHSDARLIAILDGEAVVISDTRNGRHTIHRLEENNAWVYRLLEAPINQTAICRLLLKHNPKVYLRIGGKRGIREILGQLDRSGLIWREDHHVVALGLPVRLGFWISSTSDDLNRTSENASGARNGKAMLEI